MSSELKYKNDCYGFLAVVKVEEYGDSYSYSIRRFGDEDEYWDELASGRLLREDVLLEFRGSFMEEKKEDGSLVYQGLSLNGENNVMTMNGCMDIKNGTTTVTEKDGSVLVDFDADLYTTGSGTFVWSGMCALTELEAGKDYSLITYDENGMRTGEESGEPMALLWPSVGQGFQSLAGLLFEFKYGELGVIAHENAPTEQAAETRVMSFGAAMDLSFLIPESISNNIVLGGRFATTKDILGTNWDAAEHNKIKWTPEEIRALNRQANYRSQTAKTDATPEDLNSGRFSDMTVDDTPGYNTASIVVDDVLFGGEYLGVNLEVALGIPPYIAELPALEGILSIQTVGDWSFGVDGQCHFASFSMRAGIGIKSLNDIPILDRVNFFVGGITPGFNVDGVGVLWLQGGGGGIENLYETIVMTDVVPPLKLILQAQFSIMQIFSATASLGLSLRGIDVSLTNGTFSEYTDEYQQVHTPHPINLDAGIQLDWYPQFYLQGNVNLLIAKIIRGAGYIVADAEGFYEFFLRAAIAVPTDVPIIGGYEIAEMNLGVNTTKIWGRASLLETLSIGVVYYWGGDFDWNSGSEVYPTYPELVGMDPDGAMMRVPLQYDEQTNRTLYMAFGTNVQEVASTRNGGSGDLLESDVVDGTNHTMTLAKNGNGKMLSIQWTADTLAQAEADAAQILLADKADSAKQYPIALWNKETPNAPANALLAYNEETKEASLTLVFGDDRIYGTTWSILTPKTSQLVVYDVAPLPEITAENAVVEGNQVSVELGGTRLEEFTHLTVFAEGKHSGMSYLLGRAEDPFATAERTLVLTLPEHMVSDTYSLRILASDDGDTHYSEGETEFSYHNPNQPSAPAGLQAENAGDYKVAVTVAPSEGDFDGYAFTAYDAEGQVVKGMSQILLHKDGSPVSYGEDGTLLAAGSAQLAERYLIGGHYEQTVEDKDGKESTLVTGFSAGDYTIEVRRWKRTANGAVLLSEAETVAVTVREPVRTELRVTAVSLNGGNSLLETVMGGDGTSYEQMRFGSSQILLRLQSDAEAFCGKWYLDGGHLADGKGEIPTLTQTADIALTDLRDGTHMLTFTGKNAYGDSIRQDYRFTVDTQGPRLLLAEPVNGSLFHYWTGKLTVAGVTDADAKLTVRDNTTGTVVYEGSSVVKTDSEGRFRQEITLDRTLLAHDLTITVADALGNESSATVSVMSNGLGSIDKLLLFSSEEDVTNTKMTAGGTRSLRLMARLKRPADADPAEEDLYVLLNRAGMVDWIRTAPEGQAEITDTDTGIILTTSADAEGMVTARFLVNDQGEYAVSAAFGFTGEQIRDLNDGFTQVIAADQLYTGQPRTTQVEVWYRGIRLVEGTDYLIGEYTHNVDVTTQERKAQVEIIGFGLYSGTVIGQFEIRYLEANEGWFTLSGVEGDNGFFRSDVSLLPASGYELVVDGETAQIILRADGEHTATFRIRRISDGAMTDVISRSLRIDQTAPTGTITLDEAAWNKFLETITFGSYKVQNLVATLTGEDANGIAKMEFVITGTAYESVTQLEEADLAWTLCSESVKPVLRENEDQILYVRIRDMAGNVSYLCSDGIHVDTLAPVVTVAVDVASVTGNGFSLSLTSTEAGTYHYAVLKAGQDAPDKEALLSGDLPDAITGSGSLSANEAVLLTVTGLEANTAYTVYAVAQDTVVLLSDGSAAPNTSEVASSALVVTARYSLEQAIVTVEDMLYTGNPVTPAVEVTYDGRVLTLGQDYEVVYHNNVEASATEPYAQILGIGDYSGSVTAGFAISYLDAEEYRVQGTLGNEGYYVSAVTVEANAGYELVAVEDSPLAFGEDGIYEAKFRVRRLSDGAMTDVFTCEIKIDRTAPEASVTLGDNNWKEFLHAITFGLFFNETQTVTLAATDEGSGIQELHYFISQTALSLDEVKALREQWTVYTGGISIAPDSKCVVYARITDKAGNVSYRSSDGLVVENTLAVILGVEDGGVYYGDQTVTVIDENLDSVTVDGQEVVLTNNTFVLLADNAQHTIVARDKAGNVTTVTVTVRVPVCDGTEDCPSLPFGDLDVTAWYHLYTDFAISQGLMQGYAQNVFAPEDPMSRAMMVQVLYNLEGRPAVSGTDAFTDTVDTEWYADAVLWASENGLVEGYGDGRFGPDDDLSREQMVTVFHRYSRFKGYDLTEGDYDRFTDQEEVSAYAHNAMAWAVGNGLIIGTEETLLQPTRSSTRAQFAAVLQRFVTTVANGG